MRLRIKHYREREGMTQPELAKAIGKSFRSVQQWESGAFQPNAAVIVSICEVLRCTPNELFGWEIPENRAEPPKPALTDEEAKILDAINTLKEKGLI